MTINYIFHEYMEDQIPIDSFVEKYNLVRPPRCGLIDERSLVFGPIVFRGTIAALHFLKFSLKSAGWPDLIWPFNQNEKIFDYSRLPMGSGSLLNEDFILTTAENPLVGGEFPRWIRSNSGNKTFSGGVFTKEKFKNELEFLKSRGVVDFDIVCASPKKVEKEWRFAIVGGKVISGSLYMRRGKPKQEVENDPKAFEFAYDWNQKFGHIYGGNYVLDVCKTGGFIGEYKVVETNSLLTSGLYCCDIGNVIRAINDNIHKKFPEKNP